MDSSNKTIDWLKIFEILKQNFKWMSVVMIVVTGVALVYSFTLPVIFTASTLINPPKLSDASTNLGAALGGGLSLISMDNSTSTTVAALNTNRVKDILIKTHHLVERWHVANIQTARSRLAGMVSFIPDKSSGFLAISVDSTDPKLAAEIANGYVDALSQGISDVANNKTVQRYNFYREQMLLEQKELSKAESAVKAFTLAHGINAGQQQQQIFGIVGQLSAQLVAAQANLNSMSSYASADNPDYKALQVTIKSIRDQLNVLNGQSYGDEKVPANLVPALAQEYVGLMRNQGIHEMVYKILVNQFEGYKFDFLISQAPTPIQILDKADVPLFKSKPNKVKIVFGAFLASVLLPLIFVLLRNRKLIIKYGA